MSIGKKTRILCLLLIIQFSWANKFIVRGCFENNTKLILNYSQHISGVDPSFVPYTMDIEEKDTYPISGVFGAGIEYEINPWLHPFGISFGYDYLGERVLNKSSFDASMHYKDALGNSIRMSESDTVSLTKSKYQVSYIFAKLKYYFNDSFYFGYILRKANLNLSGEALSKLNYSTPISDGLVMGLFLNDYLLEISSAKNYIEAVDKQGLVDVTIEDMPTLLVSVGYAFNPNNTTPSKAPVPSAEIPTAKTQDLPPPTESTVILPTENKPVDSPQILTPEAKIVTYSDQVTIELALPADIRIIKATLVLENGTNQTFNQKTIENVWFANCDYMHFPKGAKGKIYFQKIDNTIDFINIENTAKE